jgi:hypothetical protein
MFCPLIILILSLSLILAMGGLYFLSYTRREGLGWLSRAVGFVTVGFGIIVFIAGIVASILKSQNCSCCTFQCSKNVEHRYKSNYTCCKKMKDHDYERHTYSVKRDSMERDKTSVRKEVE